MNTPKPILIVYLVSPNPSSVDETLKSLKSSVVEIKEEYHVLSITLFDDKPSVNFELLNPNNAEDFNLAKVKRQIRNYLKKSGHTEFIIN